MDTLNTTAQDPQIVAIIGVDMDDVIHVTNVDCLFSEIKMEEGLMTIGNLCVPFQFFKSLQVCDEKMYREIEKSLNR